MSPNLREVASSDWTPTDLYNIVSYIRLGEDKISPRSNNHTNVLIDHIVL